MKILVVDDSGFARKMVKKCVLSALEDAPQFVEADSGEKGIEVFSQESPDFVFLDLLMPGLSGEEVLKEIRKRDSEVFIVVLTSNFQRPVEERILGLGANLFVNKAISTRKMSFVFETYFQRQF